MQRKREKVAPPSVGKKRPPFSWSVGEKIVWSKKGGKRKRKGA